MTSQVKFQPLTSLATHGEGVQAHLIELDDFRILLDCGWTASFDTALLDALQSVAASVDLVLLSHANLAHLGAYVYAFARLGITCPCYATNATHDMGKLFMLDAYKSIYNSQEFDLFSLEDIDNAFSNITQIKYSQTVTVPGVGITLTAHAAGHTLGGSLWRLEKDGEEIVYLIDHNHRSERLLGKAALDVIQRPAILVTDTVNINVKIPKRREIEKQLKQVITTSVLRNASALILADTAARSLEVALVLDELYRESDNLHKTCIFYFLSNCASSVAAALPRLVQFMSDSVQKGEKFPSQKFHNLHITDDAATVLADTRPKVVLVSHSGLDHGFSRALFADMCQNRGNKVIFTGRPPKGSFGRALFDEEIARDSSRAFVTRQREPLVGAELEAHRAQEAELKKKEEEEEEARKNEELEREIQEGAGHGHRLHAREGGEGDGDMSAGSDNDNDDDDDQDEEDDDDDDVEDDDDDAVGADHLLGEKDGRPPAMLAEAKRHLEERKSAHAHDIAKRRKGKRHKYNPAFPLKVPKVEWDDYGIVMDMSAFKLKMHDVDFGGLDAQFDDADEDNDNFLSDILQDVPTKIVETVHQLQISAQIVQIDFEGRSDGRSLKDLLWKRYPQHVVFVGGDTKETEEFIAECEGKIPEALFFNAQLGVASNITSHRSILKVRLLDPLVSALKVTHMDGFEVAWVDGVLVESKNSSDNTGQGTESHDDGQSESHSEDDPNEPLDIYADFKHGAQERKALMPSLDIDDEPEGHDVVYVGDLKISRFHDVLAENGFQTGYVRGVLVVDGRYSVEKDQHGYKIEGPATPQYYQIRDLLYRQFAVA